MYELTNLRHNLPVKSAINRIVIFSLLLILLFSCSKSGASFSLAASASRSGATYYVKAGGNDSLDGLSDATAWATIAKVEATAVSGDTVYFRSQDTWEATTAAARVINAKAGVIYDGTSYGTGTRAKLKAMGPHGTHPRDIGVVSIFESNVTFRGFDVDCNLNWSTGIIVGYFATAPVSNITIDNVVVHDNGDPNSYPVPSATVTVSNDANYTYFTKSGGVDWTTITHMVPGGTITWTGFNSPALNNHAVTIVAVSANVITVPLYAGGYTDTNTVTGLTHYDNWCYGILVASTMGGGTVVSNVSITNSTLYNIAHEGIALYQSRLYPGNRTNGVLVRNCTVHDSGISTLNPIGNGVGILIANDSDNVTVEYCNLYNNMFGIYVRTSPLNEIPQGNGAPDNMTVRYNYIHDNYGYGISIGNPQGSNLTNPVGMSGDFYGNLITNTGAGCRDIYGNAWDLFINQGHWSNTTLNFYNNTFYNTVNITCTNSRGSVAFERWNATGGFGGTPTFNFKNNIIYAGDLIPLWDSYDRATHSNNLIYRSSGESADAVHTIVYSSTLPSATVTVSNDANYTYFTKSADATDWTSVFGAGTYVKWTGFTNPDLNNNPFYILAVTANQLKVPRIIKGYNLDLTEELYADTATVTGGKWVQINYNRAGVPTWESSAKNTDPNFVGGALPTGFSGTYGANMVPTTNYFAISSGDALNNGAILGSPYNGCINGAGLATPILRPQGSYDIGAYQH